MFKYKPIIIALGAGIFAIATSAQVFAEPAYHLGTAVTTEEAQPWNIDVEPDGTGLPSGEGTVVQGKKVYQAQCVSCHSVKGQGGIGPRLVGGQGTLDTADPVKTVGSYWPYATTLFDYVRRTMPFNNPQSLTNAEVYAVSAYILSLNNIIDKDAVMNAKTLPKVEMPNRDGFIRRDPRPDVRSGKLDANDFGIHK